MNNSFKYDIDLPDDIDSVIEKDFWIIDNVDSMMLRSIADPIKFTTNGWILVKRGSCDAEISLREYNIESPSLVTISSSRILQPSKFSDDFQASVIIMSSRFYEELFLYMANTPLCTAISRHVYVKMTEEMIPHVNELLASLHAIMNDTENPYCRRALKFEIITFIFRYLYKFYEPFMNDAGSAHGRMTDQFLALVQDNYKSERFLEFYANKLEITAKHLSRTIKNQTGFTAVEWIERFVILEAKVLLKSTNMNIQQISDELNFPSQSFFGKYFKKYTGMSPKEYRNS